MSHSREVEGLSQDEPQLLVVAVDVPRGGAGDHRISLVEQSTQRL